MQHPASFLDTLYIECGRKRRNPREKGGKPGESGLARPRSIGYVPRSPTRASARVHACGEMPEWSNGAVSKTVVRFAYPGFESLSLRHSFPCEPPVRIGPSNFSRHFNGLAGISARYRPQREKKSPVSGRSLQVFSVWVFRGHHAGFFISISRSSNRRKSKLSTLVFPPSRHV